MASVLLPLAWLPMSPAQAQSAGGGESQANAELFYMIQQLQGEVRRLQGEIEEQRHQIDRLTKQARDRYIDLDQRILNLSSELASAERTAPQEGSANTEPSSGPVAQTEYRQPGEEERQAYESIQQLIREDKKFDEAINRLYEFLDRYPEGDLRVNAYYWLGEVYLAEKKPEQAQNAFTVVATRYADHRKAPDAIYKLGVTLDRQGETDEAKSYLKSVISNYPDSNAAVLSKKFLEQQGG